MFKHYFILNLIGICKQHRITLICLLIFIVGSQTVSAQQQIALDTHAIFERSCFNCHGPDGAYKETLLMEHNALITENGPVVPGNPEASRLYKRLLGEGGQLMPLGGDPLPDSQIETVKNWILAGAPDWAATSVSDGDFISQGEILTTVETHLMSLAPFDRAFARYFTMTHLYNAGETSEVLGAYRNGLSKLVNSLSWGGTVTNPQSIDSQQTIFYIDLRHYEWDRNDAWTQIEAVYPYHIAFEAPAQTALKVQLGRLQTEMKSNIPLIHVDWFIATASTPPLYHELLSLPSTDSELENRLGVDVPQNLRDAPGVRVWRAGFNNSGVSNHNRVVERHAFRDGAYWKSYDFAGSVGTQNIFNHPLSFTHDGGEVIFNLPNGLQAYYLVNASGSRLDAAPINIVSNPAASDPTVRNGISCFGCHTEGMKTFEDQVRAVVESNTTLAPVKEDALRLYAEKSEMDARIAEDMEKYRAALEATGGTFGDIEPISRFHEAFQGDVNAAYAAAVVGLETEAFQEKIRENVGLQNAGLLVLDSPNGSMKRDAWTSSFNAMIHALDFPEAEVDSPSQPEQLPDAVVRIPDPNLRTAIAEALGKNSNAPITVKDMAELVDLRAGDRGIRDLTGLQLATNLINLAISTNPISDYSPLAGLIRLENLWLHAGDFGISDLSPLAGLTNLKLIHGHSNPISDLSPLAGLTKLEHIYLPDGDISDLTPLAGLTGLKELYLHFNDISDLSPLANLTGLNRLDLADNNISDISPLARLTNLEWLELRINEISDVSPLAGLTQLKWLRVAFNDISNISPLANLTGLNHLDLAENNMSDVSPLGGLTHLKFLNVSQNEISDISSLEGLRENITLLWYDNPAFPKGGPKIEGPWLWVVLPYRAPSGSKDLLSEASGGMVTEVEIATHGAVEGEPVGDDVWTFRRLPPTGGTNVDRMLGNRNDTFRFSNMLYGVVSLYSPRQQNTTIYVGSHNDLKVWLNGDLIYESFRWHSSRDYTDFLPVTLQQGRNVLLVAVQANFNAFFGFEPGTEYSVANPGVDYTFSQTPIHTGDTFTLDISAKTVFDLAGWQFDIAFDPAALEAINVSEGDFLKTGGGTTFFQDGTIDNAAGKITGLSAARLSAEGVTGTGTLLEVSFKAKSGGETEVALQNFQFGSVAGDSIPAGPHQVRIAVEGQLATGDVNRDGVVSILDLILVAQQLGRRVSAGSAVDVNGDGIVSILDLIRVAQGIAGSSAAPAASENIDAAMIEAWIAQARLEDDGSLVFKEGIKNLEKLLASLIPEETALLANYPNPFNPETWIPYQLAESAEVTLTIYDMNGHLIRRLVLGHQAAGMYRSRSRAVYWDGRNQLGEPVASGLYFYTLTAGEFTETRRMLILK